MSESLLVEIGFEELPAIGLADMAARFADALLAKLVGSGLGTGPTRVYYTPRRIAVQIEAVPLETAPRSQERRGPAVAQALAADGTPTRALSGFAASCGVEVADLERLATERGEWFVHRQNLPGLTLAELLPAAIDHALDAARPARTMRWGAGDYAHVRPLRWALAIHGSRPVDGSVHGLALAAVSRGHRFHAPAAIALTNAAHYHDRLVDACVLVDPAQRRRQIEEQLAAAAQSCGGRPAAPPGLIDELVALTEWPQAIVGSFDAEFLSVPQEVLMLTMVTHQRFVPIVDAAGQLTANFVGIANVDSRQPELIRAGYERVIRPRFADARFFMEQDLRTPLADYVPLLERAQFQPKLGSLAAKTERLTELALAIAAQVGADRDVLQQAAQLSRADLMSRLVGEFPELQGTIGRRYALIQGLPEPVATAIEALYLPRHAQDRLPATSDGVLLALADRLDSLVGLFAAQQKPTASRDPYALRRAALGVVRLLCEGPHDLPLRGLLEATAAVYGRALPALAASSAIGEVEVYIRERLYHAQAEAGVPVRVLDAAVAIQSPSLKDVLARIKALEAEVDGAAFADLIAGNKRTVNLLRSAGIDVAQPSAPLDIAALDADAAAALARAVAALGTDLEQASVERDYRRALELLAGLRPAINRFFDEVLVLADDSTTRASRVALVLKLRAAFLMVADFSLL